MWKARGGFHGGYRLAIQPQAITLYHIVSSVDSLNATAPCNGIYKGCIPHGAHCLTHQMLFKIDAILLSVLKTITLKDVMNHDLALSVTSDLSAANHQNDINRFEAEHSLSMDFETKECVYGTA